MREAEDAVDEVARANALPEGVLRIAAPTDYGASKIAPIAAAFTQRYRGCRVELLLEDSKADLVAEHIDLSVRVGWLDDSSHQAKRIGTFRQFLVAAPSLAGLTGLNEPEDVANLPFIANLALKDPLSWHFSLNDFDRRTVRMWQTITSNSTPAVLVATVAGGACPFYLISWPIIK